MYGDEGKSRCKEQKCFVCCWWCQPKPQPKPPCHNECKCHQEKPCRKPEPCKPKPCCKPEPCKPCHHPCRDDKGGWADGRQAQYMPMEQQWYGGQEAAMILPYWDAGWYGGQEAQYAADAQYAPEAQGYGYDYGQAQEQAYPWPWQA